MNIKAKSALVTLSLASVLVVGGAAAIASAAENKDAPSISDGAPKSSPEPVTQPSVAEMEAKNVDHPECYDDKKMNDPSDFCYQTIGPWNSTLATPEEVRKYVTVESIQEKGMTDEQIRSYHPEFQSAK